MTGAEWQTAGIATLHTRVEAWECDFNGHWNTRFYCRAVQQAAEVASVAGGGRSFDPSAPSATRRHMRFHHELLTGDAVELRSFSAGQLAGATTAHVLIHDGRVSATALDFGGPLNESLPPLPAALHPLAAPRGIPAEAAIWAPAPAGDGNVELGRVTADDVEAGGGLTFEASVRRLAPAAQHLGERLGFSTGFARQSGIGRMLVELRFERLGARAPNDLLRATSRLASAAARSFITQHVISTHAGSLLARFDTCLLAVDLKTRKATTLPDFLKGHLPKA